MTKLCSLVKMKYCLSFDCTMVLFIITVTWVLSSIAEADIYSTENSSKIFNAFKEKYNKMYRNSNEERSRYVNFVKNLNKVTTLNEVTKDNTTFFVLNQYADLDPEEIEERYAVNIKPYYTVSNNTEAEMVGRQKIKEVDFTKMYDLYHADELYKDYLEKHSRNLTKKLDRTIHYYRFIKTLVEMNRNHFNGDNEEIAELGDTADIVKEPHEYFY